MALGELARLLVGLPFNSRNEGFKMGIDDTYARPSEGPAGGFGRAYRLYVVCV